MDGILGSRRTTSPALRAASLVLAAATLALAPAARAADAAPVDDGQVQAAANIAKTYWHATPCADQVAITWTPMAATTNATSTWANPVDAYSAPAENAQCSVAFNSALPWDWTRFCSILVHEYGHLTGHPHSGDADDVMYPYYVKPVAECQAWAPAEPAAQPELTASTASLPMPVALKPGHRRQRTATLVVVKERHKLRGRQMHPRHRHHH